MRMIMLVLVILLLMLACLRACSRDRGDEVWLGMLTQRDSIRYMRPVGWLQTALPGLLYVFGIPACALLKISR
jgi:hypothetical protein